MRLRLFTVHSMAPLSERQKKAAALMRWLQDDLHAFVVNPMPLAANQRLRFQVLHVDRNAVLANLSEQGWSPVSCDVGSRFHNDQLLPCTTFELDLPFDPPPPVQDRTIHGQVEVAQPKKDSEASAMLKHIYGKQK